jgi:hypothetical protein
MERFIQRLPTVIPQPGPNPAKIFTPLPGAGNQEISCGICTSLNSREISIFRESKAGAS